MKWGCGQMTWTMITLFQSLIFSDLPSFSFPTIAYPCEMGNLKVSSSSNQQQLFLLSLTNNNVILSIKSLAWIQSNFYHFVGDSHPYNNCPTHSLGEEREMKSTCAIVPQESHLFFSSWKPEYCILPSMSLQCNISSRLSMSYYNSV